ncbi:MAG TPA: hypothetical protein VHO70_17240 [Chitinispirillaceae bacterium]|nr:hypothetical protein [Chitinispirillaceae bacterium]
MDLFDSIDKIAPILVFIFWVIVSIFSQSQKKKKKQEQRVPGSSGTGLEYRKPEKSSQPKPTFNDLKKKLETIFSESLPSNQEPEQYEEEMRNEDTSTVKQERNDLPQPDGPLSSEESVSQQPRFEKKKWYGTDASSAYNTDTTSNKTRPTLDLSIEKIREGIILSEILAPPVSLRDNAY